MEESASNSDPMAEITALQAVAQALQGLDEDAARRVLRWAADRFGATDVIAAEPRDQRGSDPEEAPAQDFNEVADLYAATSPNSDADKALVVGYWLQFVEGGDDFDAQRLNRELKHMGHGAKNITQALSSLINRKPQLVIQTKKSGSSQQARKRYKVTLAGKQAVEDMVGQADQS